MDKVATTAHQGIDQRIPSQFQVQRSQTSHKLKGKVLATPHLNGLHHSWAFTTGDFPNNISIKESNSMVAQQNCVECHQAMVASMHLTRAGHELSCVSCHANVGHLR